MLCWILVISKQFTNEKVSSVLPPQSKKTSFSIARRRCSYTNRNRTKSTNHNRHTLIAGSRVNLCARCISLVRSLPRWYGSKDSASLNFIPMLFDIFAWLVGYYNFRCDRRRQLAYRHDFEKLLFLLLPLTWSSSLSVLLCLLRMSPNMEL